MVTKANDTNVRFSYLKMFGRLIPPEITYLREARITQQEKWREKYGICGVLCEKSCLPV